MAGSDGVPERSYGCTWGCGNPYDYVFVSVRDGTTEFLCLPCFVRLATDMVAAITEASPETIALWESAGTSDEAAPMSGNGARPKGRNAPATADDPDLFAAYDSVITEDELPAEFRLWSRQPCERLALSWPSVS